MLGWHLQVELLPNRSITEQVTQLAILRTAQQLYYAVTRNSNAVPNRSITEQVTQLAILRTAQQLCYAVTTNSNAVADARHACRIWYSVGVQRCDEPPGTHC